MVKLHGTQCVFWALLIDWWQYPLMGKYHWGVLVNWPTSSRFKTSPNMGLLVCVYIYYNIIIYNPTFDYGTANRLFPFPPWWGINCPRLEVNGIGIGLTIWLCLKTMYPQLRWIISIILHPLNGYLSGIQYSTISIPTGVILGSSLE